MTTLSSLLSPISMAFIVIILGYYLGRIKVFKVSLDLSGVLIVAVFAGWMLSLTNYPWTIVDVTEYESNMKFFSTFGTALFVSSIGLSTGAVLDFQKWKDMKAIAIGSLMACSSFAVMRVIAMLDINISMSKLLGVLCGALTTTPGLSAACELKNVIPEEAVLGYGCAYLFGVIATVLFVQIASNSLNFPHEEDNKVVDNCEQKCALGGLVQIGCTVILGKLLGNIEIVNFSLGSSGGMLCSGIVIGFIVKRMLPMKSLTAKMLTPFRNTGLVLFFVGNGIPAGMQLSGGVDLKMIIYGVLLSIIPIIVGAFFYKVFFNDRLLATAIAGGMTSTPAIGVLVEKYNNISLSKYALAYFGALITIVILIRTNVIGTL